MPDIHLDTPRTLGFDRDGTEDIAVIRGANGEELTTSRPFLRPEGDDPEPTTPAASRALAISPGAFTKEMFSLEPGETWSLLAGAYKRCGGPS